MVKRYKMGKGPMRKTVLSRLYYQDKLSMQDIANELGVSFPTVEYWMRKYNLPRRSRSDSAYYKLNPTGDPFSIKKRLNRKEKSLLLAGLMLHWAEGNKSMKGSMQLANLDHRMLQLFIKFLRETCRVHEERLRLYVRVYKKFSREKARRYWSRKLKMSPNRIFVYPHTDERSKVHKQWSQYGIATLQFHNLKLRNWLDSAIEEHIESILSS